MRKPFFLNRQFCLHLLQTTISNYMGLFLSYVVFQGGMVTFHLHCKPLQVPLYHYLIIAYVLRKADVIHFDNLK